LVVRFLFPSQQTERSQSHLEIKSEIINATSNTAEGTVYAHQKYLTNSGCQALAIPGSLGNAIQWVQVSSTPHGPTDWREVTGVSEARRGQFCH
jgi:hypothetical protein